MTLRLEGSTLVAGADGHTLMPSTDTHALSNRYCGKPGRADASRWTERWDARELPMLVMVASRKTAGSAQVPVVLNRELSDIEKRLADLAKPN